MCFKSSLEILNTRFGLKLIEIIEKPEFTTAYYILIILKAFLWEAIVLYFANLYL